MHTGPLAPISVKAMRTLVKIAKILEKAPRDEWEFILLQAKNIAGEKLDMEKLLKTKTT